MRILSTLLVVSMICLYTGLVSGRAIEENKASSSEYVTKYDFINDTNGEYVELDMILTAEQYNLLYDQENVHNYNNADTNMRKKRKALRDVTKRWTNKEVPYNINITDYTYADTYISKIKMAINEWEKNTCIIFRRAKSSDINFLSFVDDDAWCRSKLGMIGGNQEIRLSTPCIIKMGTIVHEIGHTIGFLHEQSRPDRDEYVIIHLENIQKDYVELHHNFQKHLWSETVTYGVPYDYKSIMHYGGTAFAEDDMYTIETINPAFQKVIGQSDGLSFNDIKLANLMYNCSEKCPTSIRCPKDGFVGKDCQCWCPGNPVNTC